MFAIIGPANPGLFSVEITYTFILPKEEKKGENKIKINFLPDNFLGSEIRVT